MSLLLKLQPAITQLSLYDIVHTPGMYVCTYVCMYVCTYGKKKVNQDGDNHVVKLRKREEFFKAN